jgi:hypothetical protein
MRIGRWQVAEVLIEFENAVRAEGRAWAARVCGRQADDRLWEGWIEFTPRDGGAPLRTSRETKQPKYSDLQYWATGLTVAYLEGALERALHPAPSDLGPRQVAATPAFSGPSPAGPSAREPLTSRIAPHAVLDPFEVYAQGEDVLRGQLSALDEVHLRNIILAHELVDPGTIELQALKRAALVDLVVAAVRARVL